MNQIVKHNLCVLFGCSVEHPIIEYKAVSKVSIPTSASIGFTLYGLQTLAAPHCSMYIIHHLSHALELSDVTTWGPSKNVFSCTILFWPRDLTLRWCNSHTIDYISNVVYVCRRLTCQDRNVPGGPKLIIHFCLCITFLLNRKYKYFEWWKSFLGPLQFLLLSDKDDSRRVASADTHLCPCFAFSMTFREISGDNCSHFCRIFSIRAAIVCLYFFW